MDTAVVSFAPAAKPDPRMESLRERALALYALPFNELLFEAHTVHRGHFDPRRSSFRRCCRSRPAAAPRTAPTARRRRAIDTGVEADEADGRSTTVLRRGAAPPRTPAPRASAWARPGAARRTATSSRCSSMVQGVQGAGPGDLLHAGHAEATARPSSSRTPASTTTTTTSTPRRSSTARSSPRATTRTASTRWSACATPASRSAAAASSAWARSRADRAGLMAQLASLDPHPESCRSTTWCRSKARRCTGTGRRSTRSSSCAPSRWRASRMPRGHGAPVGGPHAR